MSIFEVSTDHVVAVPTLGTTFTLKVVDGGTVYYQDQAGVSSSSNQGSLTAGQSASFSAQQWLTASAMSNVDVTYVNPPRALLVSPVLTGTPTAPTPGAGDSSTKIATTAFVATATAALSGHQWAYTQITTPVNITDTVEGTATALITADAFTPDGGAVIVELFAPYVAMPTVAAAQVIVTLFEGATEITRLAGLGTPADTNQMLVSVSARFKFTPTVAAHTYKVCAFTSSTTGTPSLGAGVGGTAAYPPAFIRFTKV